MDVNYHADRHAIAHRPLHADLHPAAGHVHTAPNRSAHLDTNSDNLDAHPDGATAAYLDACYCQYPAHSDKRKTMLQNL